ncbi:MAG: electron transport complex subunit E [Gammaproteobacteria bacterium]|nr:electron transport complex subunit E [Gammaproteobacteria bacterium]
MSRQLRYREIFRNGLWQENPGLVQLLGLCPLLAVSNTLINGLGLGIATIAVLCATNVLVSITRAWTHHDFRLPVFVLVIASFVTIVELLFKAFVFDLHLALGIFIPLIVTNCVILGRAEAFASRQPALAAMVDGLAHGTGFAVVLLVLGGAREIIGYGTLFANAEHLIGPAGAALKISFSAQPGGLLLATLPPGAFIGLAVMIAVRNFLAGRRLKTLTDARRESSSEDGQALHR